MRALVHVGRFALLLGACGAAHAAGQTCTIAGSGVAFGTYNPASATPLSGMGTVTLTCSGAVSLLDSWTISLDSGAHGTFAARNMQSGASLLTYNLYTNSSRTTVWGDGTAGTGTIADTQLLSVLGSVYTYNVYGLVTAMQDRSPGTYSDTITVTVNY